MQEDEYMVIKTTTEHLADNLSTIVRDGREAHTVQWIGGRDWIIIATPMRGLIEAVAMSTGGWVEDMDRRHARFDAAITSSDVSEEVHGFTHLIDPEVEWGDIRYGRYDTNRVPTGGKWAGWIEDHARSWIIFLGEHGAPSLYWPRRDAEGGVIGSPITLAG